MEGIKVRKKSREVETPLFSCPEPSAAYSYYTVRRIQNSSGSVIRNCKLK
jgi:hypothetical protein